VPCLGSGRTQMTPATIAPGGSAAPLPLSGPHSGLPWQPQLRTCQLSGGVQPCQPFYDLSRRTSWADSLISRWAGRRWWWSHSKDNGGQVCVCVCAYVRVRVCVCAQRVNVGGQDGGSGPGGGLKGSMWIWLRDTMGSLALVRLGQ
jgi:hypothetical protein